jgi:hypothetical protein
MQTVLIDVTDELNRLVAVAQLAPTTHLDVIERFMLHLREDEDPSNSEGAKFALDMIQATRELKSATEAYAAFVIRLSEKPRPGDASA